MSRPKPFAWWLIPWGLLSGTILTLAFLGSMSWEALPDCGQAVTAPYRQYSLPGGCATINEGFPVRFLSSTPTLEQNPGTSSREAEVNSVPIIDKGGLAEDWLIWSTASCLALYLVSARRRSVLRHRVLDLQPALDPDRP